MGNLSTETLRWNIFRKIVFRFAFIFFILFIVLLDWSVNPILSYFYYEGGLAKFLDVIIAWTGKYIFHVSYTIISPYDAQHNDRTYIYLLYFIFAMVAILGTIIWSALDRKRTNYETLYYWLTTIIRYYLAFTLFLFALEKFFKMQFPDLGLYTLTEPVGNLSPMSLAWAFFGYSYGYNIFMGIAESAALLLLFRRTMTFGAILTMVTLANVMAVNFNYDVHAKMYPMALFVMTLTLLIPHLNRLFKFFFTNQTTSLPVIQAPVFKKRWMNISKSALKLLLIGYFIIFSVKDYFVSRQKTNNKEKSKSQSEISGIFDVKSFVVNKDTLLDGSPQRWNQIIIDGSRGRIRLRGDSVAYMFVSVDNRELLVYRNRKHLSANEQEIFNEYGFSESTNVGMDSILIARKVMSKFQFTLADSSTLMLNGTIDHNSVSIKAKKRSVEIKDFRLTKNGFHWVTE
ncbi:MAG: hypothetical protein V4683_07435 [Bacteroidota bacterium]